MRREKERKKEREREEGRKEGEGDIPATTFFTGSTNSVVAVDCRHGTSAFSCGRAALVLPSIELFILNSHRFGKRCR